MNTAHTLFLCLLALAYGVFFAHEVMERPLDGYQCKERR
jgi:hypothetical protein